MKKRNVIYIDFCLTALNNTISLTPKLYSIISKNIYFYGPGFNDKEVIKDGICNFLDNISDIDILVIGPNFPILTIKEKSLDAYVHDLKYYLGKRYSYDFIRNYITDIIRSINKLDIKIKLLSSINTDVYGCLAEQIEIIKKNNFHVVGLNHQFCRASRDFPEFKSKEEHFIRKNSSISDVWLDYVKENKDRVITALHFLSIEEFNYKSFSDKREQIVVPGVNYFKRREIIKVINNKKYKLNKKYYFYIYKFLNKLNIPVYRNKSLILLYKYLYDNHIVNNRFIATSQKIYVQGHQKSQEMWQ